MARPRYRPTCYEAICLRDGTVLSAIPIRKPADRLLKQCKETIDVDNIIELWRTSGTEYRSADDSRFRFFDLMANSLNTRRNLRGLVLPRLQAIEQRLVDIETCLRRIEARLAR
jgi:hypothetical protein